MQSDHYDLELQCTKCHEVFSGYECKDCGGLMKVKDKATKPNTTNSKLREIISSLLAQYGSYMKDSRSVDPFVLEAEAEKAIRKAVAEEILEIIDSPSATLVGSDGAWIKQAELRQKITEWKNNV